MIMKKQNKNSQQSIKSSIMLDGMMTFCQLENGSHIGDFHCVDAAQVTPVNGRFNVQVMHNGDMYFTERKKRHRNSPLFRQTHSSLTLGHNDMFYFVLTMPKDELELLPKTLMSESYNAAVEIARVLLGKGGRR